MSNYTLFFHSIGGNALVGFGVNTLIFFQTGFPILHVPFNARSEQPCQRNSDRTTRERIQLAQPGQILCAMLMIRFRA